MMQTKIIFTGGGTAGHVTPNIALIDALQSEGWCINYVGSKHGIEETMIKSMKIPYHAVCSGKLRRYFSWKNFIDPLKILLGIWQSYWLMRRIKPHIIFSKGGFVAFPVVVGGWLNRIPILAHESDLSPGLANRLSFPFVNKICVTFAAAKKHFKHQDKVEITGTPIRSELLSGDKTRGLAYCGFNNEKPCLLIMGGSQGATILNARVRQTLDELCQRYQVIHLCGKGKIDKLLLNKPGYHQLEYASNELADLFAASDLVISRAGANAVYEILALSKPHIFVPLSAKVSRGDQIQNARHFQKQGISVVIEEEALSSQALMAAVDEVSVNEIEILKKINELAIDSATKRIIGIIKQLSS